MNRKFKRNKLGKVQTGFSYKTSSAVKNEEKKVVIRLTLLIFLIIGFAVILYLWGTDLVAFIGSNQKKLPVISVSPKNNSLIAPRLFDLPYLIKTKQITVNGIATNNSEVEIFVNNISLPRILVNEDGSFSNTNIELIEGENTIYAISHDRDLVSDMSNILSTKLDTQKPTLTYTISKNEDNKLVTIAGSVEVGSLLYINDRRIIILPDNTFSVEYNLNLGDNEFIINIEDQAGNLNIYNENVQLTNQL